MYDINNYPDGIKNIRLQPLLPAKLPGKMLLY
jgi:hypothetical protein